MKLERRNSRTLRDEDSLEMIQVKKKEEEEYGGKIVWLHMPPLSLYSNYPLKKN